MNVKDKQKIAVSFFAFLIILVGTMLCVFKKYNIRDFVNAIDSANGKFILIGLICIVIFIICESLNIRRTLKAMGYRKSLATSIKYGAAGFFFSGITPSAMGGQPVQLYSMSKDNIPIQYGSLALLTEVTSFQIVNIAMIIIGLIVEHKFIFSLNQSIRIAIYIGVGANIVIFMMLLTILASDRSAKKIERIIISIVTRFCNEDKLEKKIEDVSIKMAEYRKGSEYIRSNPALIIKNVLTTIVQLTAVYSIPYFVYLSLNGVGSNWIDMLFVQALLAASITIVPLPGGTGAGEACFMLLFVPFFGTQLINPGMLISRGLGFYLGLVISAIILVISAICEKALRERDKNSRKTDKKTDERTTLIITGRFGMGHISAANAIKEELLKNDSNLNVKTVDFIEYLFPALGEMVYKIFNFLTKHFNRLYNFINRLDEKFKIEFMGSWLERKIDRLIKEQKPELVVSTWPVGARYIGKYMQKTGNKIPLITCVTDIGAHREWVSECTDAYLVGDERTAEDLMLYGVPKESIFISGIPVCQRFDKPRELKSNKKREILIMGGGLGLIPDSDNVLRTLLDMDNTHVTVITGNNIALLDEISRKYPTITALGYTTNVDEYMREADILITKAGGITVFEAIHSETPLLLFKPFLSQEESNADFAIRNEIGILLDTNNLNKQLLEINESYIKIMQENMRNLKAEYKRRDISMAMEYAGFCV